jgi:3-oxoacyl-[acyl-carrier protein] reductase
MNVEKVLITGASSGIGQAAALAFAGAKSELFLVARREDRLKAVAEQCRKAGSPKSLSASIDLSVPGAGEKIVSQCLEQLEGLDVLICNAGYGFFGPVTSLEPERMARMWQVNFQSAYESIYTALPHFRGQKQGHIVLVSSIIGKKGMPYSAAYCATKFAQVGFGEALWGELKGEGIGVTVICPGYTATEFHSVAEEDDKSLSSSRTRKGQSADVVGAAILKAVRKKKREIHFSLPGKALLLIDRISTGLSTRIIAAAARMDRGGNRGQ